MSADAEVGVDGAGAEDALGACDLTVEEFATHGGSIVAIRSDGPAHTGQKDFLVHELNHGPGLPVVNILATLRRPGSRERNGFGVEKVEAPLGDKKQAGLDGDTGSAGQEWIPCVHGPGRVPDLAGPAGGDVTIHEHVSRTP